MSAEDVSDRECGDDQRRKQDAPGEHQPAAARPRTTKWPKLTQVAKLTQREVGTCVVERPRHGQVRARESGGERPCLAERKVDVRRGDDDLDRRTHAGRSAQRREAREQCLQVAREGPEEGCEALGIVVPEHVQDRARLRRELVRLRQSLDRIAPVGLGMVERCEQPCSFRFVGDGSNERACDDPSLQSGDVVAGEGSVLGVALRRREADHALEVGERRDGRDDRDAVREIGTGSGQERERSACGGADQRDTPAFDVPPPHRCRGHCCRRFERARRDRALTETGHIGYENEVARAGEPAREPLHDRLLSPLGVGAVDEEPGGPGP